MKRQQDFDGNINLSRVTEELEHHFAGRTLVGYLQGKTLIRDAVISLRGCSIADAEQIVDQLEARGFLRFQGDARSVASADLPWQLDTSPRSVA